MVCLVQFFGCQESFPDQDWREAMPVSMNGKLPHDDSPLWVKGLENEVWHNAFSRDGIVTAKADIENSSWKAEKFFEDPLVIGLWNAISDADMAKMNELIEQGADINQVGSFGMTPLYWAFHMEQDPRPFALLLEQGADPNAVVDFSKPDDNDPFLPSYAVTHLVLHGTYNRLFKSVFENGGDPNLMGKTFSGMPAFAELRTNTPDAVERLKLLIDKGANLDFRHPKTKATYVWLLVGKNEQRNQLALLALDYGKANFQYSYKIPENTVPEATFSGCYFRLIHMLAFLEGDQPNFLALVKWLEEHGESLTEAKADLKRWRQWKDSGRKDLIEQEHQQQLKKSPKLEDTKSDAK